MRYIIYALAGMGLFIPHITHARPVSYPGGVTSIIETNGDERSVLLHYSPTAKYSLGLRSEYNRGEDYWLNALQMNNLLHRWNLPDAQANIYLKSGIGVAYSDDGDFDGKTTATGFTGIAGDWENRRLFTSYENRYTEAGAIDDRFKQSARVGFAPYIGDYGDLHTWLMLDVRHEPENPDPVTVTPLVRVFYDVHLVEAGVSDQGDALFNWIARF